MKDPECVLSVMYSVKLKSDQAGNPEIKKKITKKFSSDEVPVILEQLRSFSNTLNEPHEYTRPLSWYGFLVSCKKFMGIWKQTYYEMLKI